ncbi:MAG: heavy-metal-associated domain-containing protein [Planctomycetes bacterium]|nr:heavy-metal-associated domain-containing protein [Planctomycetota bacterium]
MKIIGRLMVAVAVLSLVVALPVGVATFCNTTTVVAEDLENVHLDINGMVCGACQKKVKTALTSLPEVKDAKVNWESGGADVKVVKGSDHKKLAEAVKSAGFKVSGAKCECES